MVNKFDYSLKRQHANPRKIYPCDTGFINHAGSIFSEERGRILETVVYHELLRRERDVYYYRDERGREVDFVVCNGLLPMQLIQVCDMVDDEKVLRQETEILIQAGKKLGVLYFTSFSMTRDNEACPSERSLSFRTKPVLPNAAILHFVQYDK